MPVLRITTHIHAPMERCFDLARSIDVHLHSARATGETVTNEAGSITHGLLQPGQTVTFRARHFGVWQNLTSRLTTFDRPRHFRDTQVRGAFARFDHDHFFAPDGEGGCLMTDVWNYNAPFGILGRITEALLLNGYLRHFLTTRGREIKTVAESGDWQRFLPR